MTTREPLRVGIVGLGEAGDRIHLPALAKLPDVTVVGAADVSAELRARAGTRWRIPVHESLDALIEAARPDVVLIGTPPHLHAEQCIRALGAGAHVVCEKPFALDLDEVDRVIEAAGAASRQVALNHEFRAMPIFRAVVEATRRAPVDEPLFAQAWQLAYMPPWTATGWRGALRNHTLWDAGVHPIDLLMATFGETPHAVSASLSPAGGPEATGDAVVLATLHFSGGRLGQLTQCRISRGETRYLELRVETARSSLRASFGGRAEIRAGLGAGLAPMLRAEVGASGIAWEETGRRRRVLARNPGDPRVAATRDVLAASFAAFRDGSVPPTGATLGRDVVAVITACIESAEAGRRVEVARTVAVPA